MMFDADDAKRLALRELALADDVKRRDSDPTLGAPSLPARTTTIKTYPTTPQSYYACVPLMLLGAEVEGGPGIVTAAGATFFALNLGSTVPPPGTQLLATFVGNRWVFRYDS
jgi:hypothetical protein